MAVRDKQEKEVNKAGFGSLRLKVLTDLDNRLTKLESLFKSLATFTNFSIVDPFSSTTKNLEHYEETCNADPTSLNCANRHYQLNKDEVKRSCETRSVSYKPGPKSAKLRAIRIANRHLPQEKDLPTLDTKLELTTLIKPSSSFNNLDPEPALRNATEMSEWYDHDLDLKFEPVDSDSLDNVDVDVGGNDNDFFYNDLNDDNDDDYSPDFSEQSFVTTPHSERDNQSEANTGENVREKMADKKSPTLRSLWKGYQPLVISRSVPTNNPVDEKIPIVRMTKLTKKELVKMGIINPPARFLQKTHARGRSKIFFPCEVCQAEFPDLDALNSHRQSNHHLEGLTKPLKFKLAPITDRTCNECGKIFPCKSKKNIHVAMQHAERTLECPHCTYKAPLEKILHNHIKRMHINKLPPKLQEKAVCDQCGKIFCNKSSMRAHVKKVHLKLKTKGDKKPCPICTGEFVDLKYHIIRVHEPAKDYICDQCGAKFTTYSAFRWHINYHKKHPNAVGRLNKQVKPTFKIKHTLRDPEAQKRLEEADAAYLPVRKQIRFCPHCPYKGKHFNMKKHLETVHTDFRRFQCPISNCGLAFKAKSDLTRHTRIFSGTCGVSGSRRRRRGIVKRDGRQQASTFGSEESSSAQCYNVSGPGSNVILQYEPVE